MIGSLVDDVQIIKSTLNSHSDTLASHTEMMGSMMEDIQIIRRMFNSSKAASPDL